jgi:hypothetical protein
MKEVDERKDPIVVFLLCRSPGTDDGRTFANIGWSDVSTKIGRRAEGSVMAGFGTNTSRIIIGTQFFFVQASPCRFLSIFSVLF